MSDQDLQKIVHDELGKTFSSFVTRFWYIIFGLIISTATAWFSLYYQVQNIEATIIERQEQTNRDIDLLRDTYLRDVQEIKSDIRFIRESI